MTSTALNYCDFASPAIHRQGISLQALLNRMLITHGTCSGFPGPIPGDYGNYDTDVRPRVSPVTSAGVSDGESGNPDAVDAEPGVFSGTGGGASVADHGGMREDRVNRLCVSLLDRVGLVGWWTLAGPSPVAQMAAGASRQKTALSHGQWTALQLAFAAWRMPLIHARTDYWRITVADLLKLDKRTMRHVSAFMRGLARIGGAL